jgi:hypothetical protein
MDLHLIECLAVTRGRSEMFTDPENEIPFRSTFSQGFETMQRRRCIALAASGRLETQPAS